MGIEGALREQSGVISRTQAIAAGVSSDQIDRRLRSGRWQRLYPGVYRAMDRALTTRARIHAALLWAGDEATLSGVAAAWWHELWERAPTKIEVTVPRNRSLRPRRSVRLRRRELDWLDRTHVDGLWVTGRPLAALEAAVALDTDGPAMLDRALQRRVSFADVLAAHSRNLGRRGSEAAGRLLRSSADLAASEAERLLGRLLRAAGVRGWVRGYWLAGYQLDFAFPQFRIAIEVDGWAWHVDLDRFRGDRRRQNALELAGWTVLRFTWHDLTDRPEEVIGEVTKAVRVLPDLVGRPTA